MSILQEKMQLESYLNQSLEILDKVKGSIDLLFELATPSYSENEDGDSEYGDDEYGGESEKENNNYDELSCQMKIILDDCYDTSKLLNQSIDQCEILKQLMGSNLILPNTNSTVCSPSSSNSVINQQIREINPEIQFLIENPLLIPIILKKAASNIGKIIKEKGEATEPYLAELICKELGLKNLNMGKLSSGHGFDGVFEDSQGNLIVNETKVKFGEKGSFNKALGEGYGYRQTSQGWVEEVAKEYLEVGSPNDQKIAQKILDHLDKIQVIGIYADITKETIKVYSRSDFTAKKWQLQQVYSDKLDF